MSVSLSMMIITLLGVVVGLILSIFIVKSFHKDGRFKAQYDEMQEIARGRGFKYAFYYMVVYEAILCILSIGEIKLPLDSFALHFLGIFIGTLVLETYCIFNDAFVGLNTNGKRYIIVCTFVALINFLCAFVGYMADLSGNKEINPARFANLTMGILFLVIGIEFVIKQIIDRKRNEEV